MNELTLLDDLLNKWSHSRIESLESAYHLIGQFEEIGRAEKAQNKALGNGFNPLRQFGIDERTHSLIIGNLLDPLYEHGQECLFLHHFLRMLQIESPEKGNWEVRIESGRIDILLKRRDPHSVIVVENKSNYAADQGSQLYRYWYEQIYLPNSDRAAYFQAAGSYELPEMKSRYRILYLSPERGKTPSEQSLKKPSWDWLDETLPEKMPIIPDKVVYGEFILSWLEVCKQDLPITNNRLREYIELYMDLWK